jgi:carbon-monoxide dehydrogenase medium subunit
MYEISYERPATVAAAVELLRATGGKALAGGQTLLPTMKLRLAQPGTVVDLGAIRELRGIRHESDVLVIGAMTRHAEVAASAKVRAAIPALAQLAGGIGDRQVRNMGTIGGSVANNDPAACYPAALLALDAVVLTDRRSIPAADFFIGMYETALQEGELVTAVRFPIPHRASYVKFRQQASRFAVAGVFVAQAQGGVRVAVTGAASSVFRCRELEQAFERSFTPAAARAVALAPDGMASDLHASAEYRAHLVPVIAARAVALVQA